MTILELVERERTRLRRLHFIVGLGLTLGATGVVLALGTFALGGARWISLPRGVPFLIWVIVAAVDVAVIVWTARRLERRTGRRDVAAAIEREQAMRAGQLRGALEVANSGALGRRAADMIASRLAPAGSRLAPQSQRAARRGAAQATGAATVALAALAFAAPRFSDGFRALLQPVRAWHGTLLSPLQFESLPPAVLRGETLRLRIAARQRGEVALTQRTPGEAWTTENVRVDPRTGLATFETAPLRGDLTLVASDGRTSTDTVVVRVTDRPFVGAVSMRATYPAYIGRPAEALPIGEPARVPQGTVIDIAGRASTPLRTIRLTGAKDTLGLRVDDRAFAGRLVARTSGTWGWAAASAAGPITDLPLPISLDVVPDSAPHVEIVSPAVDTLVADNDRISLRATATDDHELSHIDLVSWRQPQVGPADAPLTQRLADGAATAWDGSPVIDLAPRALKPGDVLHVKIVATDNAPWGQFGESRELLLKIPTMEERRALAREAADSAVSQATSAAQTEKSIEDRTSDAARDRALKTAAEDTPSSASSADGQQHTMSYEQAEKAKAVAKDQRALADRVQNLQQAAAALQQQLKQAGALDSSLARQLQEAQALLRDAMTPELLAQMKKLDQATQQLSAEQTEQALKDMRAMQERLREQLEKSAEMLKRAGIEGSMQTLKDEAKDIADKERTLADSSAGGQSARDEAKHLADRSQRFSDEVQKLKDRLEKANADAGKAGADEARKRADASEQSMRQAAGAQPQASQSENQNGQKSGQPQNENGKPQPGQSQNQNNTPQAGQSQNPSGKPQAGQSQNQNGQPQNSAGKPQSGQSQAQPGQQQNAQAQRPGSQQQNGGNFSQNASDAASQMQRAADAMQQARESQVGAWKSELTNTLDKSIQEMLEMGRQEQSLAQKTRSGQAKPDETRGAQSAVKQGLDDAAKRLQQEGQKTSLLSGRSERAVAEAQQKVSDATKAASDARGSQQAASSMDDAAEALNRAAASLARDREKANTASSATGFADMLQQMQEMAKKQGSINAQAQGLMPGMGQSMSSQMQATARVLAREQRQVAQQLDDLSEAAGGDRAAELAKEAKQLADALEGGRLDATTLARQQQLFRRMLDAGRSLQKDEREDTGKRQATAAKGGNEYAPTNTDATGRATSKFQPPTWDELRGLSADERRAILDYFKRINGP